ncbi:LysR family transcriptional regulator [Ramlibacter sp. AW1]|uniref:LysR family transcriptional regulator n=1 Tax=Ramlibacter aurantiacus TaxID=2801330 RepID=A0A936ZFB4_9BURK|nr:LysR substrate-binding domain-containing protein [Ramlibacter aurantiacus]MBL0419233.1 LysR family transcriptional regulator [Ramlibacter aurantiacus]
MKPSKEHTPGHRGPEPTRPAARANPSNINFKLRQLSLLTALAETGTLRAAAERISVSQPGATRLLHELEEMLGVKLFDRVKGRMVVTAAGETMIAHASALQSGMLLAYTETAEAARGNAGQLRLGVFSSLDPELLAESLLRLREDAPQVKVTVAEAPMEFLISALRRFELDAVVGRVHGAGSEEDLRYEMLYNESFSIVSGVDHPIARGGRAVELPELLQCQWVLAPPDSPLRQRIDSQLLAKFGAKPRGTVETRSLLAHLTLLARSHDVGVLPHGLARFLEKQGQLRILVPSIGGIEGLVTFITRTHSPPRPSLLMLKQALQKNLHR